MNEYRDDPVAHVYQDPNVPFGSVVYHNVEENPTTPQYNNFLSIGGATDKDFSEYGLDS